MHEAPGLRNTINPRSCTPRRTQSSQRTVCVGDLTRGNHDTNCNTYRCFLPDLTGFVSVCCAVSNQHQQQTSPGRTVDLQGEFNPALADFGLQGTANSPSSTTKGSVYCSLVEMRLLPQRTQGAQIMDGRPLVRISKPKTTFHQQM